MNRFLASALFASLLAFSQSPLALGVEPAYPAPTGAAFARTFPYSMVGQLLFDNGKYSYSGTGTVIRPRSVLTAGHVLYDFQGGWSTDLLFQRSLYGATAVSHQYATRIFVLGGYSASVKRFGADDIRSFANDMGGLLFARPLADGAAAGWTSNSQLLTGKAYKIALGYGAEFHSGDDLLSVVPSAPFDPTLGGFFENLSLYFESGMSGGPVFSQDSAGNLFVSGIVVSGSTEPVSGGIRVINAAAARFIQSYLR